MKKMPSEAVLITGANGFVGSNLFNALKDGFHMVGVDTGAPGKYLPEDFFGWKDLDRLPHVDAIIHLAGKAHDTTNTSCDEEYFEVNVGLTQKIFDYFLQSSARKFIYFSSVKAVADSVRGEWLTEEDAPEPLTAYGKSKLEAERYIEERLRDGETKGLRDGETKGLRDGATERLRDGEMVEHWDFGAEEILDEERERKKAGHHAHPQSAIRNPQSVYVLRPAMIHGPGNKGNLNLLYRVVKKGIPWPLGAFENQRSFTSIDNLSFIIRRLIECNIEPGTYNVADDEPVSTNEIIKLIASSLDRKPQIWRLPKGFVRTNAHIGDLFHLPLNSERLKKLTETYRVSITKIKEALGIEKLPVSSAEGLKRSFQSFQEVHHMTTESGEP